MMKRTFKILALSAATAFFVSSMPNANAQIACKNELVNLNVAAGPLSQGLSDFSRQIECKINYKAAILEKLKANRVSGKYLPFNGLAMLIKGSSLEVHPVKDGFELNQSDQNQVGLQATALQATLGQAVKAQKIKQHTASTMFAQLAEVRTSVVSLAKSQGFVSAAEKASYERTFKQAQQVIQTAGK